MGKLAAKDIHKSAKRSVQRLWTPPMENAFKIKCGGAFVKETRKGGWGCVIRDHQSVFLAGSAGYLGHVSSALQAEAAACMKGLELAAQLGL
jgi:ribonuclease HI